ncbi:hypothetical protein [Blastococcus sp. SYSU D00820]
MHLAPPSRRALGLAAAGVLALSSTVLAPGGVAAAETAPAPLTYSTAEGQADVVVPAGYCSADWVVIGARGGAGSGGEAGAPGGEVRATTPVTAGQILTLRIGLEGGDASSVPGTGGSNAYDGYRGADGGDDGDGGLGGGGGGASVVRVVGGPDLLVAHGGGGGGATGGTGGAAGINVTGGAGATVGFDGTTDAPGGSAFTGPWGLITATVKPCTAPGAPTVANVFVDGTTLTVRFAPAAQTAGQAPATGYELSLDGGATWAALSTIDAGGGRLQGVRTASYGTQRVAVRATSGVGAGPASPVVTQDVLRVLGTPTAVTTTVGTSSLEVGWAHPADRTGITGYVVEATPQVGADHEGAWPDAVRCLAAAADTSCLLGVTPGFAYRVTVAAFGANRTFHQQFPTPVTTAVVPSLQVPATVPAASGPLDAGPATADPVPAGAEVTLTGSGFLPNSTVTLVVYSTPTVLGTVTTDGAGAFTTTVTLPAGLPAGAHTLVASGVDPAGNPYHLTSGVTVTASGGAPTATATSATGPGVSGGLASTGADIAVPAIGGLAALVVGGGLVLAGRRRRPAAE